MSVEEARLRMISRMIHMDASDEWRWVTIKKTHVLLKNGVVQNGPLKGKEFPNAKSTEPVKSVITKTTAKRAKEIMNSIYNGILTHEGKQGDKKRLSELKASTQGANDKEKLASLIKQVDEKYSKGVKPRIYHGITKEEIDAYRKGKDSFNSYEPSVYKNYEPITEEEIEQRRAASKARKEKMAKAGLKTIGTKDEARSKALTDYVCGRFKNMYWKTEGKLYKSFNEKCHLIDLAIKDGETFVYDSVIYTKVGEDAYQKKDIKDGRETGNPVKMQKILYPAYNEKVHLSNYKGAEPFDEQKYFEKHPIEVYKDDGKNKYSDITKTGKFKPPMPQKEARKEFAELCFACANCFGNNYTHKMLDALGIAVDGTLAPPEDVDAIKGIAKVYKYCNDYVKENPKYEGGFNKSVNSPVVKRCVEYEKKKRNAKRKKKTVA
ncbi:MAG: hypothetical protein LUD50_03065 [Clostridia bacterium]|nr:hypothetical protein [Clostridia bacterium]